MLPGNVVLVFEPADHRLNAVAMFDAMLVVFDGPVAAASAGTTGADFLAYRCRAEPSGSVTLVGAEFVYQLAVLTCYGVLWVNGAGPYNLLDPWTGLNADTDVGWRPRQL